VIPLIAVASLATFSLALWWFGLREAAGRVLATSQSAMAIVRDEHLDDTTREKEVQRMSLRLFREFASILIRGLLAAAVSLAPVWAASLMGAATAEQVFTFLSRWDVIAAATVVMTVGYLVATRPWQSN
jgi:hypothetical protein